MSGRPAPETRPTFTADDVPFEPTPWQSFGAWLIRVGMRIVAGPGRHQVTFRVRWPKKEQVPPGQPW